MQVKQKQREMLAPDTERLDGAQFQFDDPRRQVPGSKESLTIRV